MESDPNGERERAKTRQREKKSQGRSATHSSKFHQPYRGSTSPVRKAAKHARIDSTAQAGIRINGNGRRASGLGLETFTRKLRENSLSRNAHDRWLNSSVFPCSAVEQRIELTHGQTASSNCMVRQ
jgi:hypothetical protein